MRLGTHGTGRRDVGVLGLACVCHGLITSLYGPRGIRLNNYSQDLFDRSHALTDLLHPVLPQRQHPLSASDLADLLCRGPLCGQSFDVLTDRHHLVYREPALVTRLSARRATDAPVESREFLLGIEVEPGGTKLLFRGDVGLFAFLAELPR